MISLETAKTLKKAGLEWEPNFAPRLEQLLAEIEKRGYLWELSIDDVDKPPYALYLTTPTRNKKWFTAESAEEATAQALLWILNQK